MTFFILLFLSLSVFHFRCCCCCCWCYFGLIRLLLPRLTSSNEKCKIGLLCLCFFTTFLRNTHSFSLPLSISTMHKTDSSIYFFFVAFFLILSKQHFMQSNIMRMLTVARDHNDSNWKKLRQKRNELTVIITVFEWTCTYVFFMITSMDFHT